MGTQTTDTDNDQGFVVEAIVAKRLESGSEYALFISQIPAQLKGRKADVTSLLRNNPFLTISNERRVNRNGVAGISGILQRGIPGINGSQIEMFLHKDNVVILAYIPYSTIKKRTGAARAVRANEHELDRPDEFFKSIKFK